MARYDQSHKDRTRASILTIASRAFRARGIAGVAIGDVMAAAGLTHGGFYAHFKSKDELVGEACVHGVLEGTERRFGSADVKQSLSSYIRSYLSRSHRDAAATGCVIAALAGEMARGSPQTRRALTHAVETYVERVASLLPDDADPDAAWALVAGMAGSVMLSRAVDDPELSDRILKASRTLYSAALDREGAESRVEAGS